MHWQTIAELGISSDHLKPMGSMDGWMASSTQKICFRTGLAEKRPKKVRWLVRMEERRKGGKEEMKGGFLVSRLCSHVGRWVQNFPLDVGQKPITPPVGALQPLGSLKTTSDCNQCAICSFLVRASQLQATLPSSWHCEFSDGATRMREMSGSKKI